MRESKSQEVKCDPKDQFIEETILSLKKTINKNKDALKLKKELRACLKIAFSEVAAKDYAAYWRKLNSYLHADKIKSQSPGLHKLLIEKAEEEGPLALASLLTECKKAPSRAEAAFVWMNSLLDNELQTNIDESPRPIKWLMKALRAVIMLPLNTMFVTLNLATLVVLVPLGLIRMSADSVLNGITGDAYKKAVLDTAKAFNTKEVLFNNRKNDLLSEYEQDLDEYEQEPDDNEKIFVGQNFEEPEDVRKILLDLDNLVFDPESSLSSIELFSSIEKYKKYYLKSNESKEKPAPAEEEEEEYMASLKKEADKQVYANTRVYGPHRLYLIAKALLSSILSPLPERLGNKFIHIVFIRPFRLIFAPILLGLHMAIEISLSVPATLFGLSIVTRLVGFLVDTVLNIPYDLAKGISNLVSFCCKKGAGKDKEDQEDQVSDEYALNSNAANAIRKTPRANGSSSLKHKDATDDSRFAHFQKLFGRSKDIPQDHSQQPVTVRVGCGSNPDVLD